MKLQVGVQTSALNLADALEGDSGSFLCQNAGQSYLVVAKPEHSITYGPTPIGQKVFEAPSAQNFGAAQPWVITKISEQDLSPTSQERQQQQRR